MDMIRFLFLLLAMKRGYLTPSRKRNNNQCSDSIQGYQKPEKAYAISLLVLKNKGHSFL